MTKKISQLPTAATLDGTEYLEIVQSGVSKKVASSNLGGGSSLTDWDMSTNLFSSGSLRGQRYYGINGPTTTLFDRLGSVIPNGVFATSLEDNASTTDPTKWAIEYTVI